MNILNGFGVNPYILGAQIINFLILFYLLKRFAFKPIFAMLEKRRLEIEKGLKEAEEGKKALERALLEESKILKNAQTEAQTILSDAKNSADRLASEIKAQTKVQVEEMLQAAKEKNERTEKEMEKRVAMSAAKLAIDIVKESIQGVFTEKEQEEAIARFTKNLQSKKLRNQL